MELTRLIVNGGVISPGELREVVNMAMDQGLDSISFGSRQDIIFPKGFKALDKDNNQQISAAEFNASGERMFKRWDTDVNQQVTMAEALPVIKNEQTKGTAE